MTLGAPLKVTTGNNDTERWLEQIFATNASSADGCAWWEGARLESPLAVLLRVEGNDTVGSTSSELRVTEVMMYASRTVKEPASPPTPPPASPDLDVDGSAATPTLEIFALPLSSDLLQSAEEVEPPLPPSPAATDEDVNAVFLPQKHSADGAEVINEPPVRKRRSAADAFDEASERRKKARRRGGEGVIAAAASKTDIQIPSLKHRRSVSATQAVPLQTRPLSRSPSVASSRPPTAVAQAGKRSTLSQVQNTMEPNAIETKNKDFISRIVMAGMRLHGLSPSKTRAKAESAAASPAVENSFNELEAERKKDEEFKLVYHQSYKGACFAFRANIAAQLLLPFAEQVRETVDKFLPIFCSDPLAGGVQCDEDKVTPGGRKAFGSKLVQKERSNFLQAASGTSTSRQMLREEG